MTEENPGGSYIPPSSDLSRAERGYKRLGDHWSRYAFAGRLASGRTVVDVGCGYGLGSVVMRGTYTRYLGTDVDSTAIAWARNHISTSIKTATFVSLRHFVRAATRQTFDMALLFEVIEHVSDPRELLREAVRSLGKHGALVLSTPNGAFAGGDARLYRSPYHLREYTMSEIRALLSAFGGELELFGQFRIDGLDSVQCQHVRDFKLDRSSGQVQTATAKYGLGMLAQRIINGYFNAPLFWRLEKITPGERRENEYSTILAVLSLP